MFLPAVRARDKLSPVSEVNVQQNLPDIFEGLPTNENEWPEELRKDLAVFVKATNEENGLIPNAACPQIFGVTKQRWATMAKDYSFKSWTLFGKKWYSRTQLEQFHKLDRSEYGGKGKGVDMAAMARECLTDARKD